MQIKNKIIAFILLVTKKFIFFYPDFYKIYSLTQLL